MQHTEANVKLVDTGPGQAPTEFRKALGLFDSIMIVAGIMVGSGIFIVSAEISRQVGSSGWLLVPWVIPGLLTVFGALSYGELAAMMPSAGGMYVYLREAFSPLLGFLYGWTLLTAIQTGSIAALAFAFVRNPSVLHANFSDAWHPRHVSLIHTLDATTGFGLLVALCVSQTGSLFSADSWHDITFVAGEVRNPKRNLPLALGLGTFIVIALYLLCNLCYLAVLPVEAIQTAPGDRVATLVVDTVLPGIGKLAMGCLIMVSTFGTVNALTLAGGRACYAMAQDGLFFRRAGTLNRARVPGWALAIQCFWTLLLVLPRTYNAATQTYGNLYSNLLDYVISAALIFYILTVVGLFRLRYTRPDAPRPYRCWGYPWLPALYIAGSSIILVILFAYRTATAWPGLLIVLSGVPVYLLLRRRSS